jgi:hypothetical protein
MPAMEAAPSSGDRHAGRDEAVMRPMFLLLVRPITVATIVGGIVLIGLICEIVWSAAAYLHFHPLW